MRRLMVVAASLALSAPALAQQIEQPGQPDTERAPPEISIDRPDPQRARPQPLPQHRSDRGEFNLSSGALGGERGCTEEVSGEPGGTGQDDAPEFTLRAPCPADGGERPQD